MTSCYILLGRGAGRQGCIFTVAGIERCYLGGGGGYSHESVD